MASTRTACLEDTESLSTSRGVKRQDLRWPEWPCLGAHRAPQNGSAPAESIFSTCKVRGVTKTWLENHTAGDSRSPLLRNGGRRGRGAQGTSQRTRPSPFLWEKILVCNQHSWYCTSNLFAARKSGLPHLELEPCHQGALFFREEGACGRNNSKAPNRAPAPWLGHFPCFSPSSSHDPTVSHPLTGKCDKFDQGKKNFSPSSIKFCGCPERRWSLDSSRIYDCKQTVILLHNCPIALLWNILKFYGIEKVSIF